METFKITTDETLRETIQHGNNRYPFAYYPDNIWKFDFHRIDWHWHHELEFLYTAEGTALCLIGTSKIELHKGCGIFINSGVLHRFEAQSSTFAPNIVFSPTLLAPENQPHLRKIYSSCDKLVCSISSFQSIQHIWKTGATTFVANLYYSGN